LFNENLHGDQLLVPSPFSGVLTVPLHLCCVLVFSSLFIVQFFVLFCFVVCVVEDQSAQGAKLVYPKDGFGNTM
jgi:hypothetical protein